MQKVKSGSTVKAKYQYLTDGTKQQVRDASGANGYDYLGSLTLVKSGGTTTPEAAFAEGVIRGSEVMFFEKDHLGSVRAVLNSSGQVLERNDYYPFGLRHTNASHPISASNRFKFNGKEDQVTGSLGLLDYGARMYDPQIGRWYAQDPLAEKYFPLSPFQYTANNPINAIDPDGKLIFINGMHRGNGGKADYWNGFDHAVMKHLNDYNSKHYDGSIGGMMSLYGKSVHSGITFSNLNPNLGYGAGYSAGKRDASSILEQLSEGEKIKIITHSMGAAYAKGMTQALIDMGVDPSLFDFEADFAPFQPNRQNANSEVKTYQFSHSNDWVAGNKKMEGAEYIDTSSDQNQTHWIQDFMDQIKNLPERKFRFENGQLVPY